MNKIVDTGHQALVNQVLWARLRALMNEAGATLRRTAFSFPTREFERFCGVPHGHHRRFNRAIDSEHSILFIDASPDHQGDAQNTSRRPLVRR